MTLLEIAGLTVDFQTRAGPLRVVDGISFSVEPGTTVGVVGESGSGKSVTALSILRLHDERRATLAGSIRFQGEELLTAPAARLRAVRGGKIGMIFQDPMSCLDPAQRVGAQIAEAIHVHQSVTRAEADRRVVALLRDVGIAAPEERANAWPHQLSGGMRQRVMIAIALSADPELIIADEPTTALDVTIQAQILALLSRLQRERKMSLLLITHDLGLVARMCEEVVVMYAGQVVERGPAGAVLAAPLHPYTAGLLACTPVPGADVERLREIPGVVPDLRHLPSGCRFRERCPSAREACASEPPLVQVGGPLPRGTGLAPLAAVTGREHRCLFPLQVH